MTSSKNKNSSQETPVATDIRKYTQRMDMLKWNTDNKMSLFFSLARSAYCSCNAMLQNYSEKKKGRVEDISMLEVILLRKSNTKAVKYMMDCFYPKERVLVN